MHKLLKPKTTTNQSNFYRSLFRNILLASFPILIVSTLALSLPHSSASSGTDTLTITISSACTLSSKVGSEHNASINAGTYTSDIGRTTITTLCNDGNGYSIYAIGYSNNEEGNNRLINSSYPQYSIDTGLATSGLTSTWGMKLNSVTNITHSNSIEDSGDIVGSGNTVNSNNDTIASTPPTIEDDYNNVYGIIPPYWTKVAGRSSGTTDMAQGSSFTTTYAVYAASSQYAGTYEGQVKYLLTHPNSNNTTINDIDAAFWLAGKQKVYSDENGSYFAMQDMTSDICNSVSQNGERTTAQLVDIRDNKLYYVTKLKDGHCWMTQNLDLDIVAYTNSQGQEIMKPLTSEDTDLTEHSLTGAYANGYSYDEDTGVTTWTPARSAKTINFEGANAAGWKDSNTEPYTANKTDSAETGHSSLGNYYNWTAAIASNDSNTLTNNTLNDISQNPKNSICPKGWRLPTISNQAANASGSTNEFARLNYLYNNGANNGAWLLKEPLLFVFSGHIVNGRLNMLNSSSDYWLSTVNNSNTAYDLFFSGGQLLLEYTVGRNYGFPTRCVAK